MGLISFKNIKKSSVYITPNFPVLETRRYKFSLIRLLTAGFVYTLVIVLIVVAVLLFTPARNVVFFFENEFDLGIFSLSFISIVLGKF